MVSLPSPTRDQDIWQPEGRGFGLLASYARHPRLHPGKVRLVRFLQRFFRRKIVRHPGGGRLHLDGAEYLGWSVLAHGAFEPRSLALAIDLMRPGGVFLDVGANRGLFSVAVGAATGCPVVAIEPAAINFPWLLANLALNPDLRVTPVNCCASSENTLLQLDAGEAANSAWTRVHEGSVSPALPRIAGLKLDLILQRLDAPNVRLLKIDVEGYELEVFRGLDWSGPYRPRHVLMECHPAETAKLAFLRDRDYTVSTVLRDELRNEAEFPEGNLLFTDQRAADTA